MKSIVLLGAGNVATRLALALHKTDYQIIQVYNQHIGAAKILAKKVSCSATSNLSKLAAADLYIMAVKDDAIPVLANQLKALQIIPPKAIVAHTSGSQSSLILESLTKHFGVIYPLQTLKKNRAIDFFEVPIAILGNTTTVRRKLHQLGRTISKQTIIISDKQRLALHVAAVFANNFTHHMLVMAQAICIRHHLKWELLQPLIERTFIQAHEKNLVQLQTGPATRNDEKTIASHMLLLSSSKEVKAMYKMITKSIQSAAIKKIDL